MKIHMNQDTQISTNTTEEIWTKLAGHTYVNILLLIFHYIVLQDIINGGEYATFYGKLWILCGVLRVSAFTILNMKSLLDFCCSIWISFGSKLMSLKYGRFLQNLA